MRRAVCLIREALVYRRAAFVAGLRAAEFEVVDRTDNPGPGDALVIWNRYGTNDALATQYEQAGASVVVVENGYLGKNWQEDRWFALSLGQHAGAGEWKPGATWRWDSWNVELAPWRGDWTKEQYGNVVILAQRGIGSPLVRSPDGWAQRVQKKIGGRIRAHPGKHPPTVSLQDDLRDADCVVTWASTAALSALMWGIPVFCDFPQWIGMQACQPLSEWGKVPPKCDDAARLAMFRRLAWAMWRAGEVENGTAFRHLLGS